MPAAREGCAIDDRTRRTLALVGDLNELLREASSRQSEALCAANDEYMRALQAMLKARQPAQLITAQSRIVSAFLECFATQTKAWAELAQKLRANGSAGTSEKAIEATEGVGETMCLLSQLDPERPPVVEAARSAAQA
jgi:hypothetical protein